MSTESVRMQGRRNIWLCLLTKENFAIVRRTKLYGVPKNVRAHHQIVKAKPGDILVFYVISPVKAIVAIYEVSSQMFESANMAPWTDRQYPYRVRITHTRDCYVSYYQFAKPRIYMGASMIPMTDGELRAIEALCNSDAPVYY